MTRTRFSYFLLCFFILNTAMLSVNSKEIPPFSLKHITNSIRFTSYIKTEEVKDSTAGWQAQTFISTPALDFKVNYYLPSSAFSEPFNMDYLTFNAFNTIGVTLRLNKLIKLPNLYPTSKTPVAFTIGIDEKDKKKKRTKLPSTTHPLPIIFMAGKLRTTGSISNIKNPVPSYTPSIFSTPNSLPKTITASLPSPNCVNLPFSFISIYDSSLKGKVEENCIVKKTDFRFQFFDNGDFNLSGQIIFKLAKDNYLAFSNSLLSTTIQSSSYYWKAKLPLFPTRREYFTSTQLSYINKHFSTKNIFNLYELNSILFHTSTNVYEKKFPIKCTFSSTNTLTFRYICLNVTGFLASANAIFLPTSKTLKTIKELKINPYFNIYPINTRIKIGISYDILEKLDRNYSSVLTQKAGIGLYIKGEKYFTKHTFFTSIVDNELNKFNTYNYFSLKTPIFTMLSLSASFYPIETASYNNSIRLYNSIRLSDIKNTKKKTDKKIKKTTNKPLRFYLKDGVQFYYKDALSYTTITLGAVIMHSIGLVNFNYSLNIKVKMQ